MPSDRKAGSAITLRLAGASYAEIAQTLEMASATEARIAVESGLAEQATSAVRDTLRAEESARLLRLLRSVWPKATSPDDPEHLPAIKVAVGIIDRHIRLLGLDAPTEILVHNPTIAEIEAWVATVTATKTAALRAVEADVTAPRELESAS